VRKAKFITLFAALALAVIVGWQITSCVVANYELQDDLKDIASQLAAKIGLDSTQSDEAVRETVIRRADRYGIRLNPNQITVQRSGTGSESNLYLAADYDIQINLLVYSFSVPFKAQGGKER
jgi:nucleotide-binding universal stress UspA family protein